jgi:hypothetical protein
VIFSLNPHLIVAYAVSLLIPFLYVVKGLRINEIRNWLKLMFSGVLSLALNPLFFLFTFNIIKTHEPGGNTNFGQNMAGFLGDVHYTYFWSNALNVLRVGNNFSAIDYTELTFWTFPFLLLVIFLIYFSLTKKLSESSLFDKTVFPSFLFL